MEIKIEEIRKEINTNIFDLKTTIAPIQAIRNINITNGKNCLPIRIYSPAGDDLFPLVLYIHGAGWIAGSLDTHDNICRHFASRIPCILLSVDYRLAPEYKFPISLFDSYQALVWGVENAQHLNADYNRLAIAGDSAGANLAAAICLMAREQGYPEIKFQLLVNPALDLSIYDRAGFEKMKMFRDLYIRSKNDISNPYASPLLADSLSGLPDAFIITCELDVLCDEGEAYARLLRDAGIEAYTHRQLGKGHLGGEFARATENVKDIVSISISALKKAFEK